MSETRTFTAESRKYRYTELLNGSRFLNPAKMLAKLKLTYKGHIAGFITSRPDLLSSQDIEKYAKDRSKWKKIVVDYSVE